MSTKKINKYLLTDREVREKLVVRGAPQLSDAELLSILLHEGSLSTCSVGLANSVLEEVSYSLLTLSEMDLRKLRMVGGMGVKRAALVAAALELGRRVALEQVATPSSITSNDDVVEMFRPQIAHLNHEEFWVLYLSSANTLLDRARVSQGGVSGTMVDHKIVMKRAVELLASSLILIHNHPSGVATPSDDDKKLTNKIIEAASLFDISVLDHLIITTGENFSFRQAGLIE